MGFQDRDYYRDTSQSVYVTSIVVKLIIVTGVVFLAQILFGQYRDESGQNTVVSLLGVHADTIVRPLYWFQFLTAGFIHDPGGIQHIFFNLLGLYVFGMPLEERYGRKEFLRFYLIAIILGFLVWSATHYLYAVQSLPADMAARAARNARNQICFGASGGVTAVTLLFCLLYPRRTILASFLFPIPAWLLGAVIIVSNVFGDATQRVAYDVHLVGAAFAVAYWYFGLSFRRLPGLDDFKRLFRLPKRWLRPRPPLKVHDPEHYYEDLDAQADRLLEKVNQHGLTSLTPEERRILEDYSRRTRQKLR